MKHKGFSLIEVIVTVAIISILSGAMIWTYSIVNSANTKKCAEQIDGLLEKAKIQTMSKNNQFYLVIYQDASNGYFARVTDNLLDTTQGTKIGADRIGIYYRVKGELTDRQITGTDKLELTFDRATGGFVKLTGSDYVESIKITGSNNGHSVVLVSTTGKHYVE